LTVLEPVRRHLIWASLGAILLSLGSPAHAGEELCGPVVAPLPLPAATSGAQSEEIEISSDSAELSRSGDARLKGHVEVRQGDKKITAEDVEYDAATQGFRVAGEVGYEDPQIRVRGESGTFNRAGTAQLGGARFELPSRPARGAARKIAVERGGKVSLDDVEYTTCPVGNEDWMIRARDIDLDTVSRNGTGRNVRLDFKGVPILYTPVISFPLGEERKSGFLFPDFGYSQRSGVKLATPYYFNLAPNYDLVATPRLISERGIELGTEFRYLTPRHYGGLEAVYLPNDDLRDRDRGFVHWGHSGDFTQRWRVYVDAASVSDSNYFEDFGVGAHDTSTIYLERAAELNYYSEHWSLLGQVQNHQVIDQTIPEDVRPYSRLPRFVARGQWENAPLGLSYAFDGELVYFARDVGITGGRLDLEPEVSWPITGPGYYVIPRASYRYTLYELGSVPAGGEDRPSRSLPISSLDAGMIFERPFGHENQRLFTFEPRLLYLFIPFREQGDLPVFDTALPDLNLVQLFRRNRYVGADRVGDSNQLSAGLSARMLDADSGRQFLSATLGQAWFFESPLVTLPGEIAGTREYSNFFAELDLTAYQNWNVRAGLEWDPDATRNEKGELSVQYRPAPESVINVGYRFRRDLIEQVDASFAWPVSNRWNLYAGAVYSLRDDTLIEEFAGIEYASCCWRLRMVQRRYVSSRTGERDSSFALQLELNGLSSVGVPADAFLEEAIRGYSRPRSER
jgi:LPS-assembly protein